MQDPRYSYLGRLGDAAPVSEADLGEIRSKDGYVYRVTPEDVIWLARSVQFEGGDHASTIWAYAQRQAFYQRSSSLAALVRAHSQPINPLWATPGEGKCVQHPTRCTPRQIERRRQAATLPWANIRPSIRDKVLRWARGELPNPVPKAVDFADQAVSSSFIRRHPDTQVVLRAGNWYLAYGPSMRGGTRRWSSDHVTMHHAGLSSGVTAGGLLRAAPVIASVAAVTLAAGFAGWAWWRYGRR